MYRSKKSRSVTERNRKSKKKVKRLDEARYHLPFSVTLYDIN